MCATGTQCAAGRVFEDTEDATEDPEPIMVTQGEKDDTVEAILDKHIGVGAIGWHRSMEQRCARRQPAG